MAGMMYLGNQKVTPVIVQGGGEERTISLFRLPDNITTISRNKMFQDKFGSYNFPYPIDIDLNNLEVISGKYSFSGVCSGASGNYLSVKNLRVLSGYECCSYAFENLNYDKIDFDFSTIEEISGEAAFQQCFANNEFENPIMFSSLTNLTGAYAFMYAFYGDTGLDIYFPSLTSQSFGENTNQFNMMFLGASNNTVHFPSNLESVIGEWSDVLNGFMGTNTTVLFDLEATS